MSKVILMAVSAALICCALSRTARAQQTASAKPMPTIFVIGDSTVKNGSGKGVGGLWGWGDMLAEHFDKAKIAISNRALGGRSSRTYLTEGLWDKVLDDVKSGDFVLMQFGHNDGGPLNTGRARASLKGTGEQTQEVTMETTGKKEVVHTYGWYMRKYVTDAKAKGATPIVLSPVPRNMWKDGKVLRASGDYGKWAAESAKAADALFIDLNELIAKRYESAGEAKVAAEYFTAADHTHTTMAGAKVNAELVVEGIRGLKDCGLAQYLVAPAAGR